MKYCSIYLFACYKLTRKIIDKNTENFYKLKQNVKYKHNEINNKYLKENYLIYKYGTYRK